MLRDRDIFLIYYTADFISNNRAGPFPVGTSDLWPKSPIEEKALLDALDVALENSVFADANLARLANSTLRDDWIIDQMSRYLSATHGAKWALEVSEKVALDRMIAAEFTAHQPISIKYPKAEPLPQQDNARIYTEEPKIPAGNDTRYNFTRIYNRDI